MIKHLKEKSPEQKEFERSVMNELISKSKSRSKRLFREEETNDQTTADVDSSEKPDNKISEGSGETTSSKKSSKKQRSKRRRKVRKSRTIDKVEKIEVHQPDAGKKETQPSVEQSNPPESAVKSSNSIMPEHPKSILKKSPSRDENLSEHAASPESADTELLKTDPDKSDAATKLDANDWFKADLTKFAWIGVGALGVLGLAVYLARSR